MSRMPNKRAAEVLGRMLQNGVGGNYPWLAVVESEAIRTALAALEAQEAVERAQEREKELQHG